MSRSDVVPSSMGERSGVARGSDDEYCSAYPADGHHYVGHSVQAGPIRFVDRCSLCGHISSARLREQLNESIQKTLGVGLGGARHG